MGKTEVGHPEGGKTYESSEKNFGNDPRSEIVNNQDRAVNQIDKGTKLLLKAQAKPENKQQLGSNMAWFSLAKIALQAGSKI